MLTKEGYSREAISMCGQCIVRKATELNIAPPFLMDIHPIHDGKGEVTMETSRGTIGVGWIVSDFEGKAGENLPIWLRGPDNSVTWRYI